MRVLVFGAGGLIGRAVARQVCADPGPVTELVLADRVPVAPPPAPIPVQVAVGEITDAAHVESLLPTADCVFHLPALLAAETEANLRRGTDVNLRALMATLDGCAAQGRALRFVFTSSMAAFGGPLPELVDDAVARTPQTTYGTHKAMAELLIDDYTRRGLLDGRVLRLPIVLGRDAPAGTAVSDKVGALVRAPLLGEEVVCGLAPERVMPVASARRIAAALLLLAGLPAEAFGHSRAMNLPSLSVTPRALAEAAGRAAGPAARPVTWAPDAALQAVMDGWPRRFGSARAAGLGLRGDEDVDELVRNVRHDLGLG